MRARLALPCVWLLGMAGAHAQVNTASYYDQDQGYFGEFIADIGDVNGDGTHELFVGEPRWDIGVTFNAGRAWVIDADDFSFVQVIDGTQTGAQWGSAACKLGDVDADGCGDFAVGARFWNSAAFPRESRKGSSSAPRSRGSAT